MKKALFVLVAACAVVAIAWFVFSGTSGGSIQGVPVSASSSSSPAPASAAAEPAPLATSTPATTAVGQGLRHYQNTAFRFSLLYPDNLAVEEYTERGGALTVTFENSDFTEGFDVYVTPYDQTHIDAARFALDEPSGVFAQPQDVIIDGVRATMFFGANPIMGDTREAWFIHGGFLYEVATYKELDTWLGGIMKTWKFL